MKINKKPKSFKIKDGMIFEKNYYGKKIFLQILKTNNELKYRVEDQTFSSLTAAARHVVGDPTRQISGPVFWNIKAQK